MATGEILENLSAEEKAKVAPLASATWLAEVKAAQENQKKFHEAGRKINMRYLDRRDQGDEEKNKLNLFTTNVGILIATLYARFPKPMVTREFEDEDDDVARTTSVIVERLIKIRKRDDMDTAMRQCVQDRLVPGLGQVWLRYDPEIQQVQQPAQIDPATGQEIAQAQTFDKIVDERVAVDYVFWEDFLWSPARTWDDVRWVGRAVKLTKADAEKRFGAAIASQLTYKKGNGGTVSPGEAPKNDELLYAVVYELWCKRTKKVYWVSEGFDLCLDMKEDPLKLKNFFPCPKPIMALTSTSNMMPRADYLLVQDQYQELDMVNDRITWLEKAIKVVGVYDGTNAEIEQLFSEGMNLKIVPLRSFRDFAEKGGFKGLLDWIPIEQFVNALEKLREYRQDLISQIYELTGISDIMRGSSKASETLGAQQLKAQYSSVKLQFLQMEVAAFCEEVLEMKAEIIQGHFQPEVIYKNSNVQFTHDQNLAQAAIQLLKSPDFQMRVEVNADSMAVPEFNAERDGRMQYIRSISEMMTSAAPILEKAPEAGVAMLKILKWGAASFRSGNTIEGVLDEAIKSIEKAAMQPKQPPAPPPDVIAKVEKDKAQAGLFVAQTQQVQKEIGLPVQQGEGQPPVDPAETQDRMASAELKRAQALKVHMETTLLGQPQPMHAEERQLVSAQVHKTLTDAKVALRPDPKPATPR